MRGGCDDQPSALLPGLILQAMGFMMVALRQHLPRPFNSAMEVTAQIISTWSCYAAVER